MRRTILTYPDPFLQVKARPVARVDESVRQLVRDLFETMYEGHGIGLAATQVGVDRRVLVVDVSPVAPEHPPFALVNPEIVECRGKEEGNEGCLSVPGVEGPVVRSGYILVRGMDENGTPVVLSARGLLARCIQHEIDHLDGVLFIDKLSPSAATAR